MSTLLTVQLSPFHDLLLEESWSIGYGVRSGRTPARGLLRGPFRGLLESLRRRSFRVPFDGLLDSQGLG